ncbi:MAG: hypothetical protein R3321_14305, partial [Nitrososphaeraceae archaeon]|nr:hypothetical protein [Nitrososphaeraceae archaeon]
TYNLNFFTDKQEQTVEDVIKKLPGMEVDDNGTIKYLNKEISKMLIDGDDLVDDKYKLLSQNLDSDVLENIQVLRNYDDNPLRKKFGKGHEVALNLTIKDNKKNILFGKFGLSGGLPKFYQINNNLGLLKEKVKLLNINEVNNIGNKLNPIPESKSVPLEDIWSSNENKDVVDFNLLRNEIREIGFLENEDYYRNESQLTSLTGSYNSKKNFSARFVSYFSNDFRFYDDQTSQRIFTYSEAINYTEANHIDQTSPAFYSETELKYYDQESNYVTFEGSFSQFQEHFDQNIMLNEFLIDSDGKQRSQKYNANVRWTYQPNEGFLLENYGYLTYINRSESYNGLNPLEEYSTSINQHTKAI